MAAERGHGTLARMGGRFVDLRRREHVPLATFRADERGQQDLMHNIYTRKYNYQAVRGCARGTMQPSKLAFVSSPNGNKMRDLT